MHNFKEQKMRSKCLILIFVLAALLLFFAACQKNDSKTNTSINPSIKVKIAQVTRMDIIDTLRIFGAVALRQQAYLASQFDGRLDNFSLLLGNRVKKDQMIGTIIPAAREALLQISSQIPDDQRLSLQKQIKAIPLHCPLDGVVLEVYRHTGDVLKKGEHIAHIGDLTVLDIHGDLPVRYLPLAKKAKKIQVTFIDYALQPLSLPVEAFSGKININNQTILIRLKLENPDGKFRPGMKVRLSFPKAFHAQTLIIPRDALREEEGTFTVFVLNGKRVEEHKVEVGIFKNHQVEILAGINENEKVIIEKVHSLQDGMKVVVE